MTYYKVLRNGTIIDAGFTFLRWQEKHGIMIGCEAEDAQFIQSHDGDAWRVAWLNPAPEEAGNHETVEAVIIDKQEYDDLRAVLDEGETPEQTVPEEAPEETPEEDTDDSTGEATQEQPMTVQQMREKITLLTQQNEVLIGCLLEMSEIVYGD